MELLLVLFVIAVYFLPTIIGAARNHQGGTAIFVFNLLLGWTFLGWVLALVWSCAYVIPEMSTPAQPVQPARPRPLPPLQQEQTGSIALAVIIIAVVIIGAVWSKFSSKDVPPPATPTTAWSQTTHRTAGRQEPKAAKALTTGSVAKPEIARGPTEFRGLRWGTAPTKAMQKVGGPYHAEKLTVWKNLKNNVPSYLNVPVAEEAYLFQDGKLYAGDLFIDGAENFERIRAALTKQFGNPNFANAELRIFNWKWPETEVRLHYQTKFQRSTVHIERKG